MTHDAGWQRDKTVPGRMRRRDFLAQTGKAGAALAAVAGTNWLTGQAPAFAQERTLHVLEWSSFVAPADVERDRQAAEFGKQAGVKVTIEHINANDLPARATAAIEGGTGPDILQLLSNYPLLYSGGLDDHNDLIAELGGDEIYSFIRDAVRDENGVHRGVPNFFGGGANVYRKDIFEEVGIAATARNLGRSTWKHGKKLKRVTACPWGKPSAHTFGDAPGFAYTPAVVLRRQGSGRGRKGGPEQPERRALRGGFPQGILVRRLRRRRLGMGRHQQQPRLPGGNHRRHPERRQHLFRRPQRPPQGRPRPSPTGWATS